MEVREFRPGDESALHKVFFSAIHGTASANYTPEQVNVWAPAEYDRERWAERMRGIAPFVAEDSGAIVGYADLQADGYIDHFFVAASAGRRGVGSALMRRIDATAAERGIAGLYSNVSLTARPFFEHWGFAVEQEQHPSVNGVSMTNFLMRKSLLSLP